MINVFLQVQVKGRLRETGPVEWRRHAVGQAEAQAHRWSVRVSIFRVRAIVVVVVLFLFIKLKHQLLITTDKSPRWSKK